MDKKAKNMDKKELISLYESASPELRTALEKEFGEAFFVCIETIEDADKYLGISSHYNVWIDERYLERLKAFYDLSILCDAWNKQDGFVPDFNDKEQEKWYPMFSAAGCGFSYSLASPSTANSRLGSRLCFKSRERSDEFGKKYEHLFKIFLRG